MTVYYPRPGTPPDAVIDAGEAGRGVGHARMNAHTTKTIAFAAKRKVPMAYGTTAAIRSSALPGPRSIARPHAKNPHATSVTISRTHFTTAPDRTAARSPTTEMESLI